ncbi:circadian clock-controlled protein daywake-like [Lucilia sericata]|uniref:circadian clock-controlled protein daywake-like n=1 Tax=Lucilia sericata TaxID=13632 RepID=UPI0018A86A16|nr:circadian clock-controlled protein daywake-like [Lucilia sericata]
MNVTLKILDILVIITAVAVSTVNAAKFLSNKPDFLIPCRLQDPDFGKCFSKNFQVIFREWKSGIPGYKAAGSFDPIYVKRILFSQDPKNPVALNVDLSNVVVTGASNMIVQEISFDAKTLVLHAKLLVPKLQFAFDYKINGQILNLVLKSHGKGFFKIENLGMILNVQLKLRDEHGFTFGDVEKLHMDVTNIGGVHTQFDNLFNGQKDIEDSTNTLINENWRDFYEILRPAVTEAVQEIMKDRLKKSLGYVPLNYFIEDIPTAAVHYG